MSKQAQSTNSEFLNPQSTKPTSASDNFSFLDSDEEVQLNSLNRSKSTFSHTSSRSTNSKSIRKEENESEEDEEEEDVKPWFRSSSRNKTNDKPVESGNRCTTNKVSRADKPVSNYVDKF